MEAPLHGDVLLLQEPPHLLQALVEAGAALVHAHAEAGELVRQEGAREAHVEPPVRYGVEHADLAGELERVVEGREHRARDQAGLGRALRRGREEDDGVGAVAAVGVEVVLDRAHVGVAEVVTEARERLLPVVAPRLQLRAYVGKELDAELHDVASSALRLHRASEAAGPAAARPDLVP